MRGSARLMRVNWMPFLFIMPAVLLVFTLSIATSAFTLGASLTDWAFNRPSWQFVGLDNYLAMARSSEFWSALGRSGVFVGGVVVVSITFGLACALALNGPVRGRALMRAIIITPWVLSEVVTGLMFVFLLGSTSGALTIAAQSIGWDPQFLATPRNAMISLIVVESWRSIGFVMVFMLAALQSIDGALYEAAQIDGASRWQRFHSITFPLIAGTILITTILLSIGNFNLVTIILALTGGGPIRHTETVALLMWREAFEYFQPGFASSIAMLMAIVNILAVLGYNRLLGRQGATE